MRIEPIIRKLPRKKIILMLPGELEISLMEFCQYYQKKHRDDLQESEAIIRLLESALSDDELRADMALYPDETMTNGHDKKRKGRAYEEVGREGGNSMGVSPE